MGFAALLLGIAGWIVMCIPDCATAAIVPALLGTGLGSAELLRCRRRKKPVRLAAAAVLVSLSALAAALFSSADAVRRAPEPGFPPPGKEKPETPAPPEEEPEPEPSEPIELAMPVYTAEELIQKAHAAGDDPKVIEDPATGITILDYSDIL